MQHFVIRYLHILLFYCLLSFQATLISPISKALRDERLLNCTISSDRIHQQRIQKTFVPGRNSDEDLQHRRGAALLWPAQRDLPEEGEEPQRRVGLGGQH